MREPYGKKISGNLDDAIKISFERKLR